MFKFLRYFIVLSISLFFFLISQESSDQKNKTGYTATLIDFSLLGDENKLLYDNDESLSKVLKEIHNDNWLVKLNSSADFVANRRLSYAKNIIIDKSKVPGYVGNNLQDNVLGVRANFPFSKYDANIEILPKTEFDFYAGNDGKAYTEGRGVIQNIQVIKSIHVYVKGRNFPLDLYINLETHGEEKSYHIGNLEFDNWRELIWNNPDYIANFKQRDLKNKKKLPVYPYLENALRLKSLKLIRRSDFKPTVTDCVTYFAWIKVVYDKATVYESSDDEEINDEDTWGIYQDAYIKANTMKTSLKYLEIEEIEKKLMNFQSSGIQNKNINNSSGSFDDDL